MSGEEIRRLLKARPFRPFRVRTTYGQDVRIIAHDRAMVSPNGQSMIAYGDDPGANLIDVATITSVEEVPVS